MATVHQSKHASVRDSRCTTVRLRYTPGRMTLSYDLAGRAGSVPHAAKSELSPKTRRPQSVLVPLDGTPFAEHALPRALGIARRSGGTVRLVHVMAALEPASVWDRGSASAAFARALRRGKADYLENLRRRISRVCSVPVQTEVLECDNRIEALADAASRCDLVLLATRAHGPLTRLFRPSTAERLLRRITTPVLLVRGHHAPVDLTGDPRVRHILLPLDGTQSAEQVLEPALHLGQLSGAEYTLLRVVRQVSDYYLGRAGNGLPILPAPAQPATGNYPWHLAKRLRRQGVAAQSRVISDDRSVARVIADCAESTEADVIALTTHDRHGLSRWTRGSLTNQVLRRSTIPLLVCRSLPTSVEALP